MPVIPFSYDYLGFLGAGGITYPGIELFSAGAFNLQAYLVQARGIPLNVANESSGSIPPSSPIYAADSMNLVFPDKPPAISQDYQFDNAPAIICANAYISISSWPNIFYRTPYPDLVTISQFGSLNLPGQIEQLNPPLSPPLSGRACLYSRLSFVDEEIFQVQGFIKVT